jgi:hypothetical protein
MYMETTARMPSLPVDVTGVEGGFVGAVDVLDEMIRGGSAVVVVGGSGAGVAQNVAPTAGAAPAVADAIPAVVVGGAGAGATKMLLLLLVLL